MDPTLFDPGHYLSPDHEHLQPILPVLQAQIGSPTHFKPKIEEWLTALPEFTIHNASIEVWLEQRPELSENAIYDEFSAAARPTKDSIEYVIKPYWDHFRDDTEDGPTPEDFNPAKSKAITTGSTAEGAAIESCSPSSQAPRTRRSRLKWNLPIVLNEIELAACPDTGSEQNIISSDIATILGLSDKVDATKAQTFLLGNGKETLSVGTIEVAISFAKQPGLVLSCMFHVFTSLIVPALLGGQFLRQTETLTKHRQRLAERSNQTGAALKVMRVGRTRERFRCYVDTRRVDAQADTGAEMDLVSERFVRRTSRRPVALDTRLPVQFADGSTAWITHQLFTRFSPITSENNTQWTGKWFYVLPNMPCEVLLGEETLDLLDAFNQNVSIAIETFDSCGFELCTIAWADHLLDKSVSALMDRLSFSGKAAKRAAPAAEST